MSTIWTWAWCLLLAGCGQTGFTDLDHDPNGARLSGRVLTADGAGAKARVFLIDHGTARLSVDTDDRGNYAFDRAPLGDWEIFAHGGELGGALEAVKLYGAGENEVDLPLSSFLDVPRLVDYRRIDFEERLTPGAHDL